MNKVVKLSKVSHKSVEAYAPRIKADLIGMNGRLVRLTLDHQVYLVRFNEPLLWYKVHGLPDNMDKLESYVNKQYIQGEPLNRIGLCLVKELNTNE